MNDKPMNRVDAQKVIDFFREEFDTRDASIRDKNFLLRGDLLIKLRNWFVSRGTHIEAGQLLDSLMNLPEIDERCEIMNDREKLALEALKDTLSFLNIVSCSNGVRSEDGREEGDYFASILYERIKEAIATLTASSGIAPSGTDELQSGVDEVCQKCGCFIIDGECWCDPERPMSLEDDKLGSWMSAALSDPIVCKEMKQDIQAWFNQFTSRSLSSIPTETLGKMLVAEFGTDKMVDSGFEFDVISETAHDIAKFIARRLAEPRQTSVNTVVSRDKIYEVFTTAYDRWTTEDASRSRMDAGVSAVYSLQLQASGLMVSGEAIVFPTPDPNEYATGWHIATSFLDDIKTWVEELGISMERISWEQIQDVLLALNNKDLRRRFAAPQPSQVSAEIVEELRVLTKAIGASIGTPVQDARVFLAHIQSISDKLKGGA